MVRKVTHEYVYKFPWSIVTEAMWLKYPNELCPHVLDVDVINRSVDEPAGLLRTRRLFTGTSPVPKGLRWLVNSDVAYAVEDSLVDRNSHRMELNLRSLTFSDVVEVKEHCVYEPHPDNDGWTLLRQEWSCQWKVPGALEAPLERLSVERFLASANSGRQALKLICSDIQERLRSGRLS